MEVVMGDLNTDNTSSACDGGACFGEFNNNAESF